MRRYFVGLEFGTQEEREAFLAEFETHKTVASHTGDEYCPRVFRGRKASEGGTASTVVPKPSGPTLDEIKGWPATISMEMAATALGISRAHVYALAKEGQLLCTVLTAGRTRRVVTASLIRLLGGECS